MGAVAYLPYAQSKNRDGTAVWNGAHSLVGHFTGGNVICELRRPNGLWYKLPTGTDIDADAPPGNLGPRSNRYVSAALTNLISIPAGYGWGECPGNTDQPGRWYPDRAVVIIAAAAAVAAVVAARVIIRRLRPRPEPPPVR